MRPATAQEILDNRGAIEKHAKHHPWAKKAKTPTTQQAIDAFWDQLRVGDRVKVVEANADAQCLYRKRSVDLTCSYYMRGEHTITEVHREPLDNYSPKAVVQVKEASLMPCKNCLRPVVASESTKVNWDTIEPGAILMSKKGKLVELKQLSHDGFTAIVIQDAGKVYLPGKRAEFSREYFRLATEAEKRKHAEAITVYGEYS
jgi:hypothetical protein